MAVHFLNLFFNYYYLFIYLFYLHYSLHTAHWCYLPVDFSGHKAPLTGAVPGYHLSSSTVLRKQHWKDISIHSEVLLNWGEQIRVLGIVLILVKWLQDLLYPPCCYWDVVLINWLKMACWRCPLCDSYQDWVLSVSGCSADHAGQRCDYETGSGCTVAAVPPHQHTWYRHQIKHPKNNLCKENMFDKCNTVQSCCIKVLLVLLQCTNLVILFSDASKTRSWVKGARPSWSREFKSFNETFIMSSLDGCSVMLPPCEIDLL